MVETMADRMKAGALGFVFYGQRPCLDFANTLRRRKDPWSDAVDLLDHPAGVAEWIGAGRAHAAWAAALPGFDPAAPDVGAGAVAQLRAAILALAEQRLGAAAPPAVPVADAVATVNLWAGRAPTGALGAAAGGLHLIPDLTPEQVLGFVARDAVEFFGTDAAGRLKECAEPRCGILFEDRSNGGRRQWCSMKACGNRMKAHRHAGRR